MSQVICLGEVLFDLLAEEIGSSLNEVKNWNKCFGGAPANVATALVKLGTSAAFIGCVGVDAVGRELAAMLEDLGVDTAGLQYHPTAPTRQVYVLRSLDGDRSFAGFGDYPVDAFADAYLQAVSLPESLFAGAEYLTIGTLELAYPESSQAVWRALELAKKYQLKVVLDVNWRSMFWQEPEKAPDIIENLWQYVDFLKLSEEEAIWLFQTTDAATISRRLPTVEGVFVTAGSDDVGYCLGEYAGKITPPRVTVVDTTGAGDAFLAGIIHGLRENSAIYGSERGIVENIVKYACAVGALTATKMGAIASQPTAREVAEFWQI